LILRAGLKALTLLGPSIFATQFLIDFRGISRKLRDSESTEQNTIDEPKEMKERVIQTSQLTSLGNIRQFKSGHRIPVLF